MENDIKILYKYNLKFSVFIIKFLVEFVHLPEICKINLNLSVIKNVSLN